MDVPDGYRVVPDQGGFLEHVGPLHVREDGDGTEDGPVFGLRVQERHLNARGSVQGGLLATLADVALSRGVLAEADDERGRATVSLTVDYLAPAQVGDWLEARAPVDGVGGSLAFADCSVTAEDRQVVRARAVFVAVG